jgi:hypothetical protein
VAGSFTDYLENKALGHIFGGVPYTAPSLYVGLFTAPPDDTGGGTEVAGNGYVRVAATFTATGNVAANNVTVEWPTATGPGWGALTHMAVFDALTGGNMLAWGDLTNPRTILAGDIARFTINQLTITLD